MSRVLFWLLLGLLALALASWGGGGGGYQDPCLGANPPAYCGWQGNGIGDN